MCGRNPMRVIGGGLSMVYMAIGLIFLVVGCILQSAPASSMLKYLMPYTDQLNLLLAPAYAQFDPLEYVGRLPSITGNIAAAFIAVGAVQAIIGMIGISALCKGRRQPVLTVFFVAVGVMVVFQVAIIVLYYAFKTAIIAEAKVTMQRSIDEKYTGYNATNMETVLWNVFHVSLSCCGINGGKNFNTAKYWPRNVNYSGKYYKSVSQPLTCCKAANYTACLLTNHTDLAYTNQDHGCWSEIQNFVDTIIVYAALGTGALIVLEVLLLAFAASVCYTGRLKPEMVEEDEHKMYQ